MLRRAWRLDERRYVCCTSPSLTYPLDTVLSSITHDSPGCHSTTTMCTSTWHPQVKIVFNTAETPARLTGGACPTFTNTTTYGAAQTMRCDDVQDPSTQQPAGDEAPALTQDDYLYDGNGQRVMQYVNVSGTITTTAYLLGGVEESTTGVITKYLGVPDLPSAVRAGSTLSYLASDGLGSVSEAFDTNGNETAAHLYAPYGTVRYAAGTMPTAKGFTGQRTDVTTGLDYYGARYYDGQAGQFTSADSVSDGLSAYAYVAGNPETATDPTGHYICAATGCSNGNAGQSDSSDDGSSSTTPRGSGLCDVGTGFCVPGGLPLYDKTHHKEITCGSSTDPCKKTATQYANDQTTAYNIANNDQTLFNRLGIVLLALGAALALLGTGMAAFALSHADVALFYIAQILIGVGSAFAALGSLALLISGDFQTEVSNAGGASGMNYNVVWQAEASVNHDLGVGGASFFAMGGAGIGGDVYAVLANISKGASAAATAASTATALSSTVVTGGLITGAAAYAITYGAGLAFFLGKTGTDFGTQECDVDPYEDC